MLQLLLCVLLATVHSVVNGYLLSRLPRTHSTLLNGMKSAHIPFNIMQKDCDSENCAMPHNHYDINCSSIMFAGPSSHQILLKWTDTPKTILLLCKPEDDIKNAQKEAIGILLGRGHDVVVEQNIFIEFKDYFHELYGNKNIGGAFKVIDSNASPVVDLVIAFGGDGLLMHCNTLFQSNQAIPPIMAFDFGSLGFLAPFKYENFIENIDKIMTETIFLTLRMRLQCTIWRDNKPCETYKVLNEAVLDRGPSPFLAMIDIECDSQHLTTVQGDGIILATPTGSTAYSLAAGGSMVHPSVAAILLTPICAHTLSFRPLLLPDSSTLYCTVPLDSRSNCWVSFDGKHRKELQKGDRLEVKMSPYPMPTINRLNFTADWFDALRSGFQFNQRARQGT